MRNEETAPAMDSYTQACLSLVGKKMTFDYGIAMKYGTTAALALSYFAYFTIYAKQQHKYYYKERYWVPVSVATLLKKYPFLTYNKLRKALSDLEKQGLLWVANYNNRAGDKTKWYSLNEKDPLLAAYLQSVAKRFELREYQSKEAAAKQWLYENHRDLCENHRDLCENHRDLCENHKAISNTDNTSNKYNNIYNNLPKELPTKNINQSKKKFTTLLYLDEGGEVDA